jgi:hypothetical protein
MQDHIAHFNDPIASPYDSMIENLDKINEQFRHETLKHNAQVAAIRALMLDLPYDGPPLPDDEAELREAGGVESYEAAHVLEHSSGDVTYGCEVCFARLGAFLDGMVCGIRDCNYLREPKVWPSTIEDIRKKFSEPHKWGADPYFDGWFWGLKTHALHVLKEREKGDNE